MRCGKLLQLVIGVTVVILFVVGCGSSPPSTPEPPTGTPTPALPEPPTGTPTPALPEATPTPAVGIGVPVSNGDWQLTIEDVRQEPKISRSSFDGSSVSVSTISPADGFTFLIVETTFRNLGLFEQSEISAEEISVIGENGESYTANDLSEPPNEFVFTVEEEAINQNFELQFQDIPPILIAVEQKSSNAVSTEIGAEPDLLPYTCKVEGLSALDEIGRLTFSRPEETGLVVGSVVPDGSDLTPICSDIAFGNIQLTADGATLLLVTPQQGWSSLYLIESQDTYRLVSNAVDIEARFDPSGDWILFAIKQIGETNWELYTFDREAKSANLVKEGYQVDFDFLADGQLIINYRETEDSDRQTYVGATDGATLEPLDIPEDIPGNRSVSADGQHLVYYDLDTLFNFYLFVSDLNGDNTREVAQAPRSFLDGLLSPDGQSILIKTIGLGEGNTASNSAEFHNLTTDEILPIATGFSAAKFDFSADSQWASAVTTINDQHTLHIIHTPDGTIQEIDDVVNVFFSPDSTQIAYTTQQPDGMLEMYVKSLNDKDEKPLGSGAVTGWFPEDGKK